MTGKPIAVAMSLFLAMILPLHGPTRSATAATPPAAPTLTKRSATDLKGTVFQYIRAERCAFSGDLALAAYVNYSDILVVDLETGQPVQRFTAKPRDMSYGDIGIYALAFSPDKQWIFTIDERAELAGWKVTPGTGLNPKAARTERPIDKTPRLPLDPKGMAGPGYRIAGFSPTARHCGYGGKVYSLDPPALVLETQGSAVSFSADGLHVVAYGGDLRMKAELYTLDGDAFRLVRTFEHKHGWSEWPHFGAIAYEPARGLVAQNLGGRVGVWSLETGEVLGTASFQVVDIVEFSPDGELVRVRSGESGGYSMGAIFTTDGLQPLPVAAFRGAFARNGRGLAVHAKEAFVRYDLDRPPPYLEVGVAFDDAASGGNGVLDSGEEGTIVLTVRNTGRGPAVGVTARATTDYAALSLPDSVPLGAVPVALARDVRIPIAAGPEAVSGTARISLGTTEINGFDAQPLEFDLRVQRVEPPALAFGGDVAVEDSPSPSATAARPDVAQRMAGLARLEGDADGMLENGETALISVPVVNQGAGPAYGVVIEAATPPPFVHLESPRAEVGDIAPGASASGIFVVRVDRSYPEDELVLPLAARDVRASVAPVESGIPVPYARLAPRMDFTYHARDGGTAASRGDADGVIEQGELIELELSLTNSGSAAASNLAATLGSDKSGVVVDRGTATVGTLAPGATSGIVQLTFMIQRSATAGSLPLTLGFTMDDDPAVRHALNLELHESGAAVVALRHARPEQGDAIWLPVRLDEVGTIWDLAIDSIDPRTIYVATDRAGVLVSRDRGLTWRAAADGLAGRSVRCLSIVSATPTILLAGTAQNGVFRLEGDGGAWSEANKGLAKTGDSFPLCRALSRTDGEPRIVHLGTGDGLYESDNLGGKWSRVKGLPEVEITSIAHLAGLASALLVGAGNALYRSDDRGGSWESLLTGGLIEKILGLATDPRNADRMFLAAGAAGLLRSLDGGRNWSRMNVGPGAGQEGSGSAPLVSIGTVIINPANPVIVYAGDTAGHVYASQDGGDQWRAAGFGAAGNAGGGAGFLRMDASGALYAGGQAGLYQLADVKAKQSLGSVLFASASRALPSDVMAELTRVVELLLGDASLQAIVEGHTDNVGEESANLQLSRQRAAEVRSYLVGRGVAPDRITTEGYGWTRPLDTNETPEGRGKNRRVEVLVAGPAAD